MYLSVGSIDYTGIFRMEPINYSIVNFHGFVILMKFSAEFTVGFLYCFLLSIFDDVIVLPLEILFEKSVVGIQFLEIIGQLFGFKLSGVDVGMWWSDATVIGTSVDHGHDAVQLRL